MKKISLAILFFLVSIAIVAQDTLPKNAKEWAVVTQYELESLPQSAAKQVDVILQKALAEKDNQQIIKSLICLNKYKQQINQEDNLELFGDIQNRITQTNTPAEKALLHSMLAELYTSYWNADKWQIKKRTNLTDFIPEDMKEWTENVFRKKIVEHIALSIKEIGVLKSTTTKEYSDIINLGADSQRYYPTLYDFLMERNLRMGEALTQILGFSASEIGLTVDQLSLPADEYVKLKMNIGEDSKYIVFAYYQDYLRDLQTCSMESTIVLTELERIRHIQDRVYNIEGKSLEALQHILTRYKGNDACVEVINRMTYLFYRFSENERNTRIYKLCTEGIATYPNAPRIDLLKSRLEEVEAPKLEISGRTLYYPNSPIQLTVNYKNIQAFKEPIAFTLYKIEAGKQKKIKEIPFLKASPTTYLSAVDTLSIEALPVGEYCLIYTPKGLANDKKREEAGNEMKVSNNFCFVVSKLMAFTQNKRNNEHEIVVMDRKTGKPIQGASLYVTQDRIVQGDTTTIKALVKTDKIGFATFTDTINNSYLSAPSWQSVGKFKVKLGADSCLAEQPIDRRSTYWDNRNKDEDDDREVLSIFTDRSIYRPGQTVYYKAIAVDGNNKVLSNKLLKVELTNNNGESVGKKELKTNEFGSIAGEFVLPASGLLGNYEIEIGDAFSFFKVEEYKRPTFQITFDTIAQTYTFGEEVKLKGYAKGFSGVNIQDAEVKYHITREPYSYWSWGRGGGMVVADSTITTQNDGSFDIRFVPQAGEEQSLFWKRLLYSFTIQATITDSNGETQESTYTVNVGNVSMVMNLEIPDKIEKSTDYKFAIEAKNLQGVAIKTIGHYTLYTVNEQDSIGEKIIEGVFNVGEQTPLQARLKQIASGKYQLQIVAADDRGNEIKEQKNFLLYAYADKKPPIKTNNWLVQKNTTFSKNKPAEVIFGASDKDVYALYQLYNDSVVFERKIIQLSDANILLKVPYKNEYGDKIYMSLIVVRDEKTFQENILLSKEEEKIDTQLQLKLSVFRDKLRPGQEETWTMSIQDNKGKPVQAELLASMYDVSLDKLFRGVDWNITRAATFKKELRSTYYRFTPIEYNQATLLLPQIFSEKSVVGLAFDKLRWFGYPIGYGNVSYSPNDFVEDGLSIGDLVDHKIVVMGTPARKKETMVGSISTLKAREEFFIRGVSSYDAPLAGRIPGVALGVKEDKQEAPAIATQIRSNFKETAFFYPQLRTNEKGETLITFTVPESNTIWRFRALAHDKNLRVGQLQQMVVTRKELMVTPNMPRFMRQGDKATIATKISNLSDSTLSGEVRIEFFDPTTNKTIDLALSNQKQAFSLASTASSVASWAFDVPFDIDVIGCRIVAQSQSFSDGEQHALAVLSNRMLVTESMPFEPTKRLTDSQLENKESITETFSLSKLASNSSASLSSYKLTLQYASNPAWYAIQALPTLSNPTNENAVNWFASYYVNRMGASILAQHPKVASMLAAWKQQGATKETLVSHLQTNVELKTLLLEETPWVLEAKNETEQMSRLSLLFDLNNTNQQVANASKKLAELQSTESGAWTWYKGMYPSRSITQYILYGYTKLQEVGMVEYANEERVMQIQALKYIDKEIGKDLDRLKKDNLKWQNTKTITTSQLEYLYVRSSYRDIPLPREAMEAVRFYTSVVTANWTRLNLYERSLLTLILLRDGDKVLATKIAKSIREHATKNPKMGMYWADNRSNVFMSLSAVSTQVFVMDALQKTGADDLEMNEMKRWLLQQKQTQLWESTHASIDAISALINTGSNWFEDTTTASLKVGGKPLVTDNEIGTGYVKSVWNKTEINPEMGEVVLTYTSNKPSFGALYWQYYEDIAKITAQGGELNVNKQLFIERVDASGKSLMQITDTNPLTLGDKVIVRLTVRVDRDMEFVQLKDMRAACFEPVQTLSGINWNSNLLYYQTTKDASTNFFFDYLPKGTYVFEYPVYANNVGTYANGITSIQCAYAPQFVAHTAGITVTVKDK